MGAEQQLMQRLFMVFKALEEGAPAALAALRASARETPDQLTLKLTPNQKLLEAAVAYVNAWPLASQAPGVDKVKARKLALRALQVQRTAGHGVIPRDAGFDQAGTMGSVETLTSSHAQLWHAGAASLLVAGLMEQDGELVQLAVGWWRAEAALCHLTAWKSDWKRFKLEGSYQVIAPGARGGERHTSPGKTEPPPINVVRDLNYELLLTGRIQVPRQKIDDLEKDRYTLATWLLSGLTPNQLEPLRRLGTGVPLPGPDGTAGPWTDADLPLLPQPLLFRRAGNRHSAWFQGLSALEPQLQAGVDAGGPWFKFFDDTQPPLVDGGPSPWPPPDRPDGPVRQAGPAAGSLSGAGEEPEPRPEPVKAGQFLILLRPTRPGMLTEGPTPQEETVLADHLAYLQRLNQAGTVQLAGRTTEDDESTLGLVVLRAATEAEARGVMEQDPVVKQGVMTAELRPFRIAVG